MYKPHLQGEKPSSKANNKDSKSLGFTLAEVLVTMAVLGIIASMTIPSLMKSYQKQQWIAGYKQTFSIINQATRMIMADNGGTLLGAWEGNEEMMNAYIPYLKIVKQCGPHPPAAEYGDCFADSYTKLDGSSSTIYGSRSVILSNGTSLAFDDEGGTSAIGISNFIYMDTNGKKGPNTRGKDLHKIRITINSDPVKPYMLNDTQSNIQKYCNSTLTGTIGDTCGVRILRGDYAEDY